MSLIGLVPRARAWLSLFKPRIVALLVLTALTAAVVAQHGPPSAGRLVWLAAAGALASMGACALNNFFDRDLDRLMLRTRARPLVTGEAVRPASVLVIGLLMVVAAVPPALRLNPRVMAFTLAGAGIYVLVYTLWLKRKSIWNIVIGGAAGSCAVLAGWAAVRPDLPAAAWLLALLLFLWTPPHFWAFVLAHHRDYRRAGTPMLPLRVGAQPAAWAISGHVALVVAVSLWLARAAGLGPIYLVVAALAGLGFLGATATLLRYPDEQRAWRAYKTSGLYLLVLLVGMVGDVLM